MKFIIQVTLTLIVLLIIARKEIKQLKEKYKK